MADGKTDGLLKTGSTPPAEAWLAAIIESSNDAIVSKDLEGAITSWNSSAERLFGYAASEMVGRSIRIIIPPDRQAEEDEVLRRIVNGQTVDHFETVRRRKDGREIFVSLTVSPMRDAAGRVVGASKIARDVTAHKREAHRAAFLAELGSMLATSLNYEETLANIVRLTIATFPGAPGPLADYSLIDVLEDNGELRRVAAAHRDSGREPLLQEARRYPPATERSVLTQPIATGQPLLIPQLTPAHLDAFSRSPDHSRIMQALGPRSLMTVPLTARGKTLGIFTMVRSEQESPFDEDDLRFATDIGRRAALALDNSRLYQELQHAVRMRDQVLAVVSHDLRNALGTIATAARLLRVEPVEAGRQGDRADTIARVCAHANRLVQDLQDASRLQAGRAIATERTPIDIAAVVREACDSHRAQVDIKRVSLACDIDEGLPPVNVDRHRVLQALSNVIGNAAKFTPDGGSVRIRAQQTGGFVQISVTDTGPGIKGEDLPRIFEPFWQSSSTAAQGTGLGLTITKGIVEAHGGRIWVESAEGAGASFFLTLPAAS